MNDVVSPWLTRTQAELHRPVDRLVGARTAKALAGLGVHSVGDLLTHVPRRYLSGTETTDLSDLVVGTEVALVADVARVEVHTNQSSGRGGPRKRLELLLTDGRATLPVTFFGRPGLVAYWQRIFSAHTHGIFVGKVGSFRDRPQLTHPNFVMLDAQGNVVAGKEENRVMVDQVRRHGLVGLYSASSALPTWDVAACQSLVLEVVGDLEDTLPSWVREEADLVDLTTALSQVHHPQTLDQARQGQERLVWEEALATQVTMAVRRRHGADSPAPACPPRRDGLLAALDARLPFALTEGQQEVGRTLSEELSGTTAMHRLLQGEVGSGKTLVALRAMLQVVDAGHQAVLLAPTEVLAHQHHRTITGLLGELGAGPVLGAPEGATSVALLTGSMRSARAKAARQAISDGSAGIVIGTHALLSAGVDLHDIGLVVVDEQHRFGVAQRSVLSAGAEHRPHELVLTATPIPRTVAMTVFGDLEISTLTQLPVGRAEVQTTVVDLNAHRAWLDRAWQRAREEIEAGHQVFVVCPRISESDAEAGPDGPAPSAAVEALAPQLARGPLSGLRVEALHSRLDAAEKDEVMARFVAGESDVLVSTTVIEVGVDVPRATMMVVMDADRFGVSQLHQLRGRIGRGDLPGLCLLVSSCPADSPARKRLDAVASTRDGFALAELDLAQRREGDVLGSSQAGRRSPLRLLRVLDHAEIVTASRDLARRWVDEAPDDPRLVDLVRSTEMLAEGDLMEQG